MDRSARLATGIEVTVRADELQVRFGRDVVGDLYGGDVGRMTFEYAPSWLARADAFPISISLPLRPEPYAGDAGHTFFSNLLPEGHVRDAVCRRLGISADNDMALLRAIGGDCAGALSIVDANVAPPETEKYEYERLDDKRLQALVSGERIVPLLVGGPKTRLSLAGAQDKVPIAILDDRIMLPLGGAPSTHILKLPHRDYKHIPVNEAFVMGLAARIGLHVVSVELTRRTGTPSLIIERYDRRRTDQPWPAIRLHQEDLCQALGLPASRKYEEEGGPTLVSAIELVRSHVTQPLVDVDRLIRWQAFNIVAGNSDGHGKNLSIVHDDRGPRLAPFYDLLATRQYDKLDRRLAMGVGGVRDPDKVGPAQWIEVAKALGLSPRVATNAARTVAEQCIDEVPRWKKDFAAQHGNEVVLQTLPAAILRRARRVLRLLAAQRD